MRARKVVDATSDGELDTMFGKTYRHFDYPELNEHRSRAEGDFVQSLLELQPGDRVLDAPCGHGRLGENLARSGMRVVGLDRDREALSVASARPGASSGNPNYVHGDLRRMRFEDEFDVAISWYGSFGYFDDDTDRQILRRYAHSLVPGGRLLIDLRSLYRAAIVFGAGRGESVSELQNGDDVLYDVSNFDAVESRAYGRRFAVIAGVVHRSVYQVRYFTASEIESWLLGAGFASVRILNEYGARFDIGSRRMIAIATK